MRNRRRNGKPHRSTVRPAGNVIMENRDDRSGNLGIWYKGVIMHIFWIFCRYCRIFSISTKNRMRLIGAELIPLSHFVIGFRQLHSQNDGRDQLPRRKPNRSMDNAISISRGLFCVAECSRIIVFPNGQRKAKRMGRLARRCIFPPY